MNQDFFDRLELIENTGSSIEKENIIIKMLEECPEAEEFFRLTFNDDVYGLAEKTFYNAFAGLSEGDTSIYPHVSDFLFNLKDGTVESGHSIAWLKEFANMCLETSGNDLQSYLVDKLKYLDKYHRKWFSRCLLKDLRSGVQRKTINHCFAALGLKQIEKFALQLCDKIDIYDDYAVNHKLKFPIAMECKYDGIRLQAEVYGEFENRKVKLTSRRGKDRTSLYPEICETLKKFFPVGLIVLDGEIISRSFQSLTRKDNTNPYRFIVFDYLVDERLPYSSRYDNLRNLFSAAGLLVLGFRSEEDTRFTYTYPTNVELAEHYSADKIEEVRDYYEKLNERKEEGIVLKLYDSSYERGSRKYMFKCKKVQTADLVCIDYKLGEGKRAGMVSTLCLQDKSETINVDVGSGITDDMSQKLTNQLNIEDCQEISKADFIGSIVEILYNEITETGSLRFPRFIKFRDDKDEPDDLSNTTIRQAEKDLSLDFAKEEDE